MNYYERHIGDYLKDTAHLSLLEHGIYTRLLDVYYTREQAIPDEQAERVVGAKSKEERAALRGVLAEFFVLRDGAWHQARCNREIARYSEGEPEREAKKANTDNRLKRHREERARLFKAITDAGLHADWNIKIDALRELARNVSETVSETPIETRTRTLPATAPATPATATQTPDPDTRSQDKDSEPIGSGGSPPGDPPPDAAESESGLPDDKPSSAEATEPIPYRAIVEVFNATMTRLSKVRDLTPKRRTLIRTAWLAHPYRRSVEFWQSYADECESDPFLNGSGPYANGHENWRPTFDYLLKNDVVTRVIEKAADRFEREQTAHV